MFTESLRLNTTQLQLSDVHQKDESWSDVTSFMGRVKGRVKNTEAAQDKKKEER